MAYIVVLILPARILRRIYSRLVHYRIDEKRMTVEQVWEYGKEAGSELFSRMQGSSYLLSNGNIMGTWSSIATTAEGIPIINKTGDDDVVGNKILEVDPTSNEIIFETSLPDIRNYRTFRSGFYSEARHDEPNLTKALNDRSKNDLFDRIYLFKKDILYWLRLNIVLLKRYTRLVLKTVGL